MNAKQFINSIIENAVPGYSMAFLIRLNDAVNAEATVSDGQQSFLAAAMREITGDIVSVDFLKLLQFATYINSCK